MSRKSKKQKPPPKPKGKKELAEGLKSLCQVILNICAYHNFELHIDGKIQLPTLALTSLRNAAIDATLLNIRAFNEFLGDKRYDDDDLRLHHYNGQVNPVVFLTASEAADINKYVMHLTERRARIETKGWDIDKWVYDALLISKQLLGPVTEADVQNDADIYSLVCSLRDSLDEAMGTIKKVTEVHSKPNPLTQ